MDSVSYIYGGVFFNESVDLAQKEDPRWYVSLRWEKFHKTSPGPSRPLIGF